MELTDRLSWKRILLSPWFCGALIIVLTILAYLPAMHAGFIWDDDDHLTQNACIVGPLGFRDIWLSSSAVYYPLVLTTFWLLHKFIGLNPLAYHLFNVIVHLANVLLIWRVLRLLKIPGAWFGAALWALHPVMVQSVAWITELKNTQSCFFYLLSILFFLKADENEGRLDRWRFSLSLLFFALAVTSKTSTVMLPVVLALCIWWRRSEPDRRLALGGRDLIALIPFLCISVAAGAWTIWEQKFHSGALGAEWVQTWPQRFALAGRDVWFYCGKLFWPHPLIFIYPLWKIDTGNIVAFFPTLSVVATMIFLWWKRNGSLRPVFFAGAYFLASLFPVLGFFNVYFFRYSFVSDHFQYLAAIGPLVLVGSASVVAFRGSSAKKPRAGLPSLLPIGTGAALLGGLALLTWNQTKIYHDNEKLWNYVLSKNPGCWMAHNNLGNTLLEEGQTDQAISHLREAVTLQPHDGTYRYNLANALAHQRNFSEAFAAYRDALSALPDSAEIRNNFAIALVEAGQSDEAVEEFKTAVRIKPDYVKAHYNLGRLLLRLHRPSEALLEFKKVVDLKPDFADAKKRLEALEAANVTNQ
jgi:tetratricopeptide (TPR) repeat protein